ncbi:RNA polymerase, sigma 54 subunit, RpoN/SigL [Ferrimonas sediminum]|uniref:RNA polymerase sigma-54 factor n=1 Tax=Ferrimonas sediminum TaxID=718193 RepID=A0A1G8KBL3_9GAMM|nr:RNA polymerase factor sigma-54 [Ferrimonas sediminum]SDI40792.1 RNA polymerase, sigma 54 subunit, RpoN/SigL [Ferrimonas sediminum]
MKTSLQLKLGQQLTMTPQLQQAIRLLQLSTLDLQQEIQEALDSNPLLEADEEFLAAPASADAPEASDSGNELDVAPEPASLDTSEALSQTDMPDDLQVDTSWDEYYTSAPTSSGSASREDDMPFQGSTSDSLQDHLLWQMELTPMSDTDRAIAIAIIDATDERGYLTQSSDEILEAMGDDDIELDEVEAVLKRVQRFDPIGVCARDLGECLLVQLSQFDADTPWKAEAEMLIKEHMDLLANRDFRGMMRKTRLSEEELKLSMELIQTLNPRPGSALISDNDQYVIPDVAVSKKKGRWVVELNPETMPKIRINEQYAALSRHSRNQADSQFVRGHLQEAKWFIKSLESRNDTLLKVANCIVQFQQGFLEYGDEAMKPMVLNDVAEAVDMHESTISRVTTQKYMHTPRGIFELKYFFSSHVSTENGGECSSTAIRALIKKLVAAENPRKPLSDSKMAELLAEQGIKVARRTIAKYREALSIAPSNQRKSL